MKDANQLFAIEHPYKGRTFKLGQVIRKYDSGFSYNDAARKGWYVEGVIMQIDPWPLEDSKKHHIWYKIEKVVLNGESYPQSFLINTLGDFFSDDGFVFIIGQRTQLEFNIYKPHWK